MTSVSPRVDDRTALHVLWALALGVAALGTAICFEALPGVNWGIWTTAASLGLVVMTRHARGAVPRELVLVLALACATAFGAAIDAGQGSHLLVLFTTLVLLAVAALIAAGARAEAMGAAFLANAAPVAGVRAAAEAVRRVVQGAELLHHGRRAPAVRGAMIAVPVLAVLALLLSGADPVFAGLRDDLANAVTQWGFVPRAVFFAALGALSLGTYGLALRVAAAGAPQRATPAAATPSVRVGDTERLITLGSVAALFTVFLVLQLSYLFGNVPSVHGNGVTYAEYARRGFGELTVAASLTTLLIIGADRFAEPGPRDRTVRLVALVLVALVQLLLDSAYHRVMLYEQAYGFTAARLYAQTYMIVVSLVLVALGYEIWDTIDVKRLARRAAVLGAGAFIVLTYWNHEAWIVRRNVALYATTGRFDPVYLARDLSPDAVPELVRALPALGPTMATRVRACLHAQYGGEARAMGADHRWFEWNGRRERAVAALHAAGIDLSSVQLTDPSDDQNDVSRCAGKS
jgi:hypothetical protein